MAALFAALLMAGGLALFAAPSAAAQSTVSVSIQNFAIGPPSITVVIGIHSTVTWTNMDSTVHTVTADNGAFGSNDLSNGQTFTFTFTSPGTYGYHCSIHTYMKGTVVVKGSSPTTTTTPTTTSAPSTTTTSPATTTSPTTTTATATSPTYSSGGVPEFPFQGALLAVLTLAVMVSYFAFRRNARGRNPMRPPRA